MSETFPKLNTLTISDEQRFDESDAESLPLKRLKNLSRPIPQIIFIDGSVRSGEETERMLHKILDMHLTRVLQSVIV